MSPLMTRAAASALLAVLAAVPASIGAQQGATFRAQSEAAWVTATVVDEDGHLLTDLNREDFEIREDGAVREITTFRSDPIPFAAAIMIDISGSMETAAATVHLAADELIKRFEPGDRARIGAFDSVAFSGGPFTSNRDVLQRSIGELMLGPIQFCAADPVSMHQLDNRGATALWDGIGCAIVMAASDAETPRRVAIVVSDGMDNFSQLKVAEVIDRANTYGVMVYGIALAGSEGLAASDMRGIAEATGGGYYVIADRSRMPAAFARIAEELRHQYVLGFSPAKSGAVIHGVTVRSLRPQTATHSRQVYLTTAPVHSATALVPPTSVPPKAAPSPESAPLPPGVRSPVVTTLERFASADWTLGKLPALTIDQLRLLHRDLRRDVPSWVAAGEVDDQPRRRLAVATFVLDLLSSQRDPFLWNSNQAAWNMLDWTEGMLRDGPPLPAERQWYLAAIALLERADVAKELELFVGRAQGRFPNDERLMLDRAIAQDLNTWPQDREGPPFAPNPAISTPIVSRYEEAAAFPSVRAEALLRLGFFELRRGRVNAALARFEQVSEPQDKFMRYWLGLMRGRALEEAGRLDDAIASYQMAFDEVPFARSATVALCAALVAAHRDGDAQRLASRMLVSPPPADPWTVYVLPDWRFWGAMMDQLHNAVAS